MWSRIRPTNSPARWLDCHTRRCAGRCSMCATSMGSAVRCFTNGGPKYSGLEMSAPSGSRRCSNGPPVSARKPAGNLDRRRRRRDQPQSRAVNDHLHGLRRCDCKLNIRMSPILIFLLRRWVNWHEDIPTERRHKRRAVDDTKTLFPKNRVLHQQNHHLDKVLH